MSKRSRAPERNASTHARGSYLPVSDPEFVGAFLEEYFQELGQEARRVCWKHKIQDFADDAVSIAVEKFMSSRIEDRGPRSAIAFAMKIVKNTCIDEVRRRGRHAVLAGSMTGDLDPEEHPRAWLPEPRSDEDPEREVLARLELHALRVGFLRLPELMADTHRNASRDLEIVQLRYIDGLSWNAVADEMGIDKAHRQSAARGRELLRGWVHALCGTQPEPEAVNRKYWLRGFEKGTEFREMETWPPTGSVVSDLESEA